MGSQLSQFYIRGDFSSHGVFAYALASGGMGSRVPVAAPAAVRGVFRCIARHCNHLDNPQLLPEIKKQFQRRRWVAKLGHIRAAFNLEDALRQVCLGSKSIEDVYAEFKAPTKKATHEKNAHGKYKLWIQHENRRLDAFNVPPTGSEKRRVDRMAKLSNRRWNYVHKFMPGLSKSDLDMTFIDTVLAPGQYCRPKPKMDPGPRRVDLKTIIRAGELTLLKVSGLPSRNRGFKMHMIRVLKDIQPEIDNLDAQIKLAQDYAKEDAEFADWVKWLQRAKAECSTKLREKRLAMEVQRRILIRRQQELQQQWKWRRDRHLTKQLPAPTEPLRLETL